eukprot:3022424-Alexandrium_andersonii.AAC.1
MELKKKTSFKKGWALKQLRNFGVGCSSNSGNSDFAVQATPRKRLRCAHRATSSIPWERRGA